MEGSTACPQVGHGALPGGIDESGGMTGAGRTETGGGTDGGTGGGTDGGAPAAGLADTLVAGTPNCTLGLTCSTPPIVSPSAALTAPLVAMGLPQSMQNFDAGSFSRPQTEQRMVKSERAGEWGEYRE